MALYKNGSFIKDAWRSISEGEDAPPAGHVILPLDWWLAEREAFEGSNAPLGLRLDPGASVSAFLPDLHRFSLLALAFPKFQDGRNFSLARLLRERHGFSGELRAVGEVLLDQIQAMARCGFDAFEITDPNTERALREGRAFGVSHFYQPSLGRDRPVGDRPWIRRSAH
ncbi:MAG TPA: DUF934 domain-containing protein [Beijerinckiaceae bacterium]|nr:DUF934 domain-containing protein [Beijerinckiaceae bacterium]